MLILFEIEKSRLYVIVIAFVNDKICGSIGLIVTVFVIKNVKVVIDLITLQLHPNYSVFNFQSEGIDFSLRMIPAL